MRHLTPLAVYAAAALTSLALVGFALRLWRADLDVPLALEGDNWMNLAWAKGIAENGWYLRNDRLGTPHEMDLRDFPMTDVWHFLCLKALLSLGCSAARAVNLYFLVGFPLAALSALAVLRRWGVALGPAFVVGQLYAVMPFHFTPGQSHLFLSSYYLLPPLAGLALGVWRDGGPTSRRGWLLAALLLAFAGGSGVYYAFYTCFFLLVAGASCALRQRRFRPLFASAALVAMLAGSVAACAAPTILHQRRHLDNPQVGRRYPMESMRFGLHFSRLFVPVKDHYAEPLADWRRRYDTATLHYPTENNRCSLGLVASAGLLYLLGRLLSPSARQGEPATDDALSLFGVTGLLLAMTGGGMTLFAVLVSPTLRAHARMNALLAFFALAAAALVLTRLGERMRGGGKRPAFLALLAVLLIGGSLDQTGWAVVPDHEAQAEAWHSDAAFFAEVEAGLSPGDAVFCLPVLSFPEAQSAGGMHSCYEQLRGYVHTRSLRFSYGAIRNRYAGAWHERLADAEAGRLLDVLRGAGFAGVLIDRHGFTPEREGDLRCLLGESPLESADGRLAFYALSGWPTRGERREVWPVLATWHGESSGDENGTRWLGDSSCVVLHNPTGEARKATLTMPFVRALPGRRSPRLRVEGEGWKVEEKVPLEGWVFRREVTLLPGENRVRITATGPQRDRLFCPRRAVAAVEGFAFTAE